MKPKLIFAILGILMVFSIVLVAEVKYQKPKTKDSYSNKSENNILQDDNLKNKSENIESNNQPSIPESNISEKLDNTKINENKDYPKHQDDSIISNKNKEKSNSSDNSNKVESSTTKENKSTQSDNNSNVKKEIDESSKNVSDNKIINESKMCSIENTDFIKYLNNWKMQNPYSLVFYSQDKLNSYIEKATKVYGYGAWKSSIPIVYKNNDCSISFYSAMLYIPKTSCVNSNGKNNEKMYINATLEGELINKYQYLSNLGYVCEGKTW